MDSPARLLHLRIRTLRIHFTPEYLYVELSLAHRSVQILRIMVSLYPGWPMSQTRELQNALAWSGFEHIPPCRLGAPPTLVKMPSSTSTSFRRRGRVSIEQVRVHACIKTARFTDRAGQNGARLEGWDFIQEKILCHDEDMISDLADDIDTLLVFVSGVDRFSRA